MLKTLLVLIFWMWGVVTSLAQNTIKVPSDYSSIQAALDVAESGTVVLVAPGTYIENIVWPQELDGISLISESGALSTILDGGGQGRVIYMEGERIFGNNPQTYTTETLIEGFTIQNGTIDDDRGAGIFLEKASPTLRNLHVQGNQILNGAGAGGFLLDFAGLIEGCHFTDNRSESGSTVTGIGLYLEAIDDVSIIDCSFENNTTDVTARVVGGGIYLGLSSEIFMDTAFVHLKNCKIINNVNKAARLSQGAGVAIYNSDSFSGLHVRIDSCVISDNVFETELNDVTLGGGVHVFSSSMDINNSEILRNQAALGAGVALLSSISGSGTYNINNSIISNNTNLDEDEATIYSGNAAIELNITNSELSYNNANVIRFINDDADQSQLNLRHCTIAYNEKGISVEHSKVVIENSILWNNSVTQINGAHWSGVESDILASNTLIKNGSVGQNILDSDPLVVSDTDLTPSPLSPCLSAGSPLNSTSNDLLGNLRPMPANSYPDIGAYEIDQYFAHVQAKFYYDENENGFKDGNERYVSFGSINVQDDITYNNFRPEGIFVIVDQGQLTISYDETANQDWHTTTQEEFTFDVNVDDYSAQIEIGLYPNTFDPQVESYLTSGRFRCGEEVDFSLSITNHGTTIESGAVYLELDNSLEEFNFSLEPDYVESAYRVGWNFGDLYPQESMKITFTVVAPLIEVASEVGELYTFKHAISEDINRNVNCYEAELRCSFDPNDKLVSPDRDDNLALVNQPLFYTIRFQNTGNDYARNVSITDMLDSKLNLQTFKVINTSHPEELLIYFDDGRTITFDFPNIYLPDSTTNNHGSNGFVSYTIETNENVELESVVENTASIFFDFNPAIITNTTVSILVEDFPSSLKEHMLLDVDIYPNPTANVLNFSREIDQVKLYDLSGRLISSWINVNSIRLDGVDEGVYFMEVEKKGNWGNWKIVVRR